MSLRPITKALAALDEAEALLEEAYMACSETPLAGEPKASEVLYAFRQAGEARREAQYLLRPES